MDLSKLSKYKHKGRFYYSYNDKLQLMMFDRLYDKEIFEVEKNTNIDNEIQKYLQSLRNSKLNELGL